MKLKTLDSVNHARPSLETQTSKSNRNSLVESSLVTLSASGSAPWQVPPVPAVTRLWRHGVRCSFLFPSFCLATRLHPQIKEKPLLGQTGSVCTLLAMGSVTAHPTLGPLHPVRAIENGSGNPFFGKASETNLSDGLAGAKARSEPKKGSPAPEQPFLSVGRSGTTGESAQPK